MMKKIGLVGAVLLFGILFGQKKEQLQQQNAELKKQIAGINSQLAKTRSESRLSVAYLEGVKKKIELREKVYQNTQKEKRFIEDDIYLRQLEINRQNRELAVLRQNYAKVLVNAYKNRDLKNKVTFILSSRNLGEAIRRVQYLRFYSDYQDKQAAKISQAADLLKRSIEERSKSVQQKEILLANQQKEITTINVEKQQKEKLLAEFKKNENTLTAELKQKQTQSRKLEGEIRSIIAEEMRIAKAEEESRKKAEAEKIRLAKEAAAREKAKIDAENKAKAEALEKERLRAEAEAKKAADLMAKKEAEEKKRAEEAAKGAATARDETRRQAAAKESAEAAERSRIANEKLAAAKAAEAELDRKKEADKKAADTKAMTSFGVSSNAAEGFAQNRGRMTMPAYGTITHRFGRQAHPVFKNIVEDNIGIKIAVSKGTTAKSIFPGVISKINLSSDGSRFVTVKHGDYFTVYANLSSVSVKLNQQVSAGTPIGVIGEDFDGTYTLDFQIWNGKTLQPMDPLGWIN